MSKLVAKIKRSAADTSAVSADSDTSGAGADKGHHSLAGFLHLRHSSDSGSERSTRSTRSVSRGARSPSASVSRAGAAGANGAATGTAAARRSRPRSATEPASPPASPPASRPASPPASRPASPPRSASSPLLVTASGDEVVSIDSQTVARRSNDLRPQASAASHHKEGGILSTILSAIGKDEPHDAPHHSQFSNVLDLLLKPANKVGKSHSSLVEDASEPHSEPDEEVPTSNVHFESIRESPVNTLGAGDLSLHFFDRGSSPPPRRSPPHGDNSLSFASGAPATPTAPTAPDPQNGAKGRGEAAAAAPSAAAATTPAAAAANPPAAAAANTPAAAAGAVAAAGSAEHHLSAPDRRRRRSVGHEPLEHSHTLDSSSSEEEIDPGADFKFASKKRNADFHSIFKDIPRDERLIDDFSCAISKEILVQGRIYLSSHYVCFNSNILGWVTNLIIPLQEVIQIEKKATAVLFPNGMVIRTLQNRYVFATFISRDSIFSLITTVWHRVLMGSDDPERRARAGRAEEDEEEPDDDDDAVSVASAASAASADSASASSSASASTQSAGAADAAETPGDYHGLPIVGPSSHAPTDNNYTKGPNDTFICDETLDAPVGVIYQLMFGDDTSKYISMLKDQKNFDISEDSIVGLSTNNRERRYSYIKPLGGSIGPKQTKCIITDTLKEFAIDSAILVEQVSQTPDVPSGSSFVVKTKIYLSWAQNNATRLYVVTSVEWSAKSWLKGAIEKGSIDGQKESMKALVSSLNAFVQNAASAGPRDKRKRRKRRGTAKSEEAPPAEAAAPPPPPPPQGVAAQLAALLATIGDTVPVRVPYVGSSVVGAAVVAAAYVAVSAAASWLLGGARGAAPVEFVHPHDYISRIRIDGSEYTVLPSVDTTLADSQLVRSTELALWNWIRDRSDGKIDINTSAADHPTYVDWTTDYSKVKNTYSKQEVEEMLALTRLKLKEIQNQLLRAD
ncbi:VASt domain-containing protein [[Candida] zeylanoides]